jgi:hypothetical protein
LITAGNCRRFFLGKAAVLFLKKKRWPPANKKTFITLGPGRWPRQRPEQRVINVFAELFSKSDRFLSSNPQ